LRKKNYFSRCIFIKRNPRYTRLFFVSMIFQSWQTEFTLRVSHRHAVEIWLLGFRNCPKTWS
jgi:hypothetical protein